MARAHVRESFTVRYPPSTTPVIAVGAVVHVYDVGTTSAISGSLWDAKSGGSAQGNPLTADAAGAVEFWLDTTRAVDLVVSFPGLADRRITVEPQSDPDDVVRTSGTQTRGTGLTLTSPVLNTPTINSGTFSGVSLTNPTLSGGSWAGGTLSSPAFSGAISGAMTVLGTGSGGKGGLAVNTDGGITFGRQVAGGAVASSMVAGNWEMPSTGTGFALLNLAAVHQASGADSALVTASAFEGWTSAWQTSTAAPGQASNWMTGEWRMVLGTDTNIAAGYHSSRVVGGFGLTTNTQATVASDGTNAVDQVGVFIDSRGTFPATNRAGGAQSTAGVRGGAALWLSHGENGWWHLIVATKLGAGVVAQAIVPAFAVTKEGWVGSNVWATARFHGKWESGTDAANADIAIMESDSTATAPSQYVARGLTATTKRLALGFNTSSNFGAVDAMNGGAAAPLLLQPNGGPVSVHSADLGVGRFAVKQLTGDGANTGFVIVQSGSGTKSMQFYLGSNGDVLLQQIGTATRYIQLNDATDLIQTPSAFRADGGFSVSGQQVMGARKAAVADVTSTIPATGGTGATAGAFDTAAHRDDLINAVSSLKTQFNALASRFRVTGGHGAIAD